MASGCPVASSNAASLPEVCGDAAVYFDPTSVDAMAAAVRKALEGELVEKGLQQAARFTWEMRRGPRRRLSRAHRLSHDGVSAVEDVREPSGRGDERRRP